jgi:hypothetical protein
MVCPPERSSQSGRREHKRQHLAVELADLGIRLHKRPGAALDFGEGLQDLRPRAP